MVEQFIIPENLLKEEILVSPSGRYQLTIGYYKTRAGCWEYTKGTVTEKETRSVITSFVRQYCVMQHSFFTRNGEEWFQSGTDYLTQLFVNLNTGTVYNNDAKKTTGNEFCWAKSSISPDGKTLAVLGCYWACPYHYLFYDFSHPEQGWPELKFDKFVEDLDEFTERSGWNEQNQFVYINDASKETDEYDEKILDKNNPSERMVLVREGDRMVIVEHYCRD